LEEVCSRVPLDADHEDELGLSRNVVRTLLLAQTSKTNLLALCFTVFFNINFCTLEDNTTFLLSSLNLKSN
jgi:hypothetical protein